MLLTVVIKIEQLLVVVTGVSRFTAERNTF